MSKDFSGLYTALVTPFKKGEIDFGSLKKLIRFQLENGVEGFIVCGSTAEVATLRDTERFELLRFVRSEVAGQVPVIFGSGTNNTQQSVELSQQAEKNQADGLLTVVPYYNKPPQRGLEAHFKKIAGSTSLPLILYNVPGRTITALASETVVALSKVPNIVGIKEATGEVSLVERLVRELPSDFLVTSGDDPSFVPAILKGARGVISVVAHLAPRQCRELCDRARRFDVAVAGDFEKIKRLSNAIFVESNPMPVKMGLFRMGIIQSPECRLPLVTMEEKLTPALFKAMGDAGVSL